MMAGTLEAVARRTWKAATPGARALRGALVPAAAAYAAMVTIRNRLYDAGWLRTRRVPARVLSVGNITVGGTGKTPTVLWLAQRLAARGWRVGIVARGYRKRRRGDRKHRLLPHPRPLGRRRDALPAAPAAL